MNVLWEQFNSSRKQPLLTLTPTQGFWGEGGIAVWVFAFVLGSVLWIRVSFVLKAGIWASTSHVKNFLITLQYPVVTLPWKVNKELKQRRSWATDGNRNSNVSFFGAFLLLTTEGKALVGPLWLDLTKRGGVKTLQKGKESTSGCRPWLTKRLCLSSLISNLTTPSLALWALVCNGSVEGLYQSLPTTFSH